MKLHAELSFEFTKWGIPGQITKARNLDISDFDKTGWNGSPQEVIQMCKIFLVCDH